MRDKDHLMHVHDRNEEAMSKIPPRKLQLIDKCSENFKCPRRLF